jgi:hypothetical protein
VNDSKVDKRKKLCDFSDEWLTVDRGRQSLKRLGVPVVDIRSIIIIVLVGGVFRRLDCAPQNINSLEIHRARSFMRCNIVSDRSSNKRALFSAC